MTAPGAARTAGLFEVSTVGQVTVNSEGIILDVNHALADLLGYAPADMVGAYILSFAHPQDREWDTERVTAVLSGALPVTTSRTRRYLHASGRIIWARFSATVSRHPDGDFLACAVEDVTGFVAVERQNRLLLEVLALFADAPDFNVGVRSVLARLCEDTPWSMAQLWLPAEDGDVLACAQAWHGSGDTQSPLRSASLNKAAMSGEGLVGAAWEAGKPQWWGPSTNRVFGRAVAAQADGLHSGVAIPLIAFGRPTGVVELFSPDVIAHDDPVAELIIGVAPLLGPALSRRRDEQTIRDSEHRLRVITDGTPVAVVSADAAGRIVDWNTAAETLFGLSRDSVTGRPVTALLAAEVREDLARYLTGAASRHAEDVAAVTVECLRSDGVSFPAEVSVSHWDWLGSPHYTAIFRDVSAQRDAGRRSEHHSERLAAIVAVQNEVLRAAASVAGVQQLVVDRSAALFACDGAALELHEGEEMVYVAGAGTAAAHIGLRLSASSSLSGLTALTAVPQMCADTEGDDRVDAEACRRVGVRAMLVVPLFDERVSVGALKVMSAQPRAWTDDDRRTLQLLAASVGTAMSNARRHEEAIARADKALYDELTGLPRRELLSDRMRHAHQRMVRNHRATATFFIDLDGFKAINDNFGHAVGDELLVAVAARLGDALRGSDTAARFGGDEFVAFCEDVDDTSAHIVAERLVDNLTAPYQLSERLVTVTASIGVVVSDDPADSPDSLISRADEAMYVAKRAGKARSSFAAPVVPSQPAVASAQSTA